jgi:glycosyltransferase involved in cell wall biosynthesis
MKACFIIKYPPIQGGVSRGGYWMARELAERGHQIYVVTNANEVEDNYRIYLDEDDREWYEPRFEQAGGFVKVRHTQPLGRDFMHIPQSNPFVSKLASAATQVVRKHGCEVIFGYYMQPYGMAAYLASLWTGVPFMLRHAGSDLGRLMKQRDLTTAYREVFKAADCVWSGLGDATPFLAMGVKEENLWRSRAVPVPRVFSPQAPPLDVNSLLEKFASSRSAHVQHILTNTSSIDLFKPTIGIYGKVGEVKGSFDLLNALGSLKREGYDFNLLALTQGNEFETFKTAIRERDLQDKTWTLPFIAHWKVPGFIRACTAVCFLERDFPISFHGPNVAKEVFASGTCLILSREIAEKQVMRGKFEHGENLLIVEDPKDHPELAERLKFVIENPKRAKAIGAAGRLLLDRGANRGASAGAPIPSYIEALEERLRIVAERRKGMQAGEAPATTDAARKSRLKTCLFATSALLNGSWEQVLEQYCQHQSEPSGDRFRDAVQLCEFIEAQHNGSNAGGYLKDVLKYEKATNLMYTDFRAVRAPADEMPLLVAFGEQPPRARRRNVRDAVWFSGDDRINSLVPVKARGSHVLTFDHDLEELMASLARGESPGDPPKVKKHILFKKELNFVNSQMELSEPMKQLLDLCDGKRTLGEVANELDVSVGKEVGQDKLRRELAAAVRELSIKGVIWFI